MMKFLFAISLLLGSMGMDAQLAHYQGYCTQGAVKAQTQGLASTNTLQSAFPGCTVKVYNTGTQTLATIYADTARNPQSNPFTANSTTGFYSFYPTQPFDVQMSATGMATTTLSNITTGSTGLTLTTFGSSGPATLTGSALNIPNYAGGSGGFINATGINNLAFAPSTSGDGYGGGEYTGFTENYLDNVRNGVDNGFGDGNDNYMRSSHGHLSAQTSVTPGIFEGTTQYFSKLSPGDSGISRIFANIRPGGAVGPSDENNKDFYVYHEPIFAYKANVTARRSPTEIVTTPIDSCGMVAFDRNCLGAQLWLVKLAGGPIYSGHATAMVYPTLTSNGTLTVDNPVTVSPGYATVPGGIADMVIQPGADRFAGESLTFAIANVVGNPPAPGSLVCVGGGSNYTTETMTVTASTAGSITVSDHRYPHFFYGSTPPLVFFNACMDLNPVADSTAISSKIHFTALGATDAHTIVWMSVNGGGRSGNGLGQNGDYLFRVGTNDLAKVELYQASMVISASDPTITDAQLAAAVTNHNGYAKLDGNGGIFAMGDGVEEAEEPALIHVMHDEYDFVNMPNSGIPSVWASIHLGQYIGSAMNFVLFNNHAYDLAGQNQAIANIPITAVRPLPSIINVGSDAPAQLGAFSNFGTMAFQPQRALLETFNCQGGPNVGDPQCQYDKPYYLITNNQNGDSMQYNGNSAVTGGRYLNFQYPSVYFSTNKPVSFGSGLTANGLNFSSGNIPSSSSSTGTAGDMRANGGFVYYCDSTNHWIRVALATF